MLGSPTVFTTRTISREEYSDLSGGELPSEATRDAPEMAKI